ncbi:MAG: hypothetical protein ACI8QZ_001018 [Chlamydiales bacterium]|jgi:hypothetical protein
MAAVRVLPKISTAVATAGRMLLLSALVGPTLAQGGPATSADDPAPRVRVSGIRTLHTKSRIVYRAAPERPHLMEAAFAFPDRGYTRLVAETPTPSPARSRFQLGTRVFAVNPPNPTARAIALLEKETAVRGLVLRRALMLWPRTLDWQRAGTEAQAELGSAGRLVARFDGSSELPISIASETSTGDEYERFTSIDWSQAADEAFAHPTSMKLEAGGAVIWEEVVLEYDPRANFVDSFFVPPEQRGASRRTTSQADRVLEPKVELHPLPARTVRRFELDPQSDWPTRWAKALEIAARTETELEATGDGLHPALAFELDGNDRPATLILRLAASPKEEHAAPPPGWTEDPLGRGTSVFVPGITTPFIQALETLRGSLKSTGQLPGRPYMVIRRAPEPGRAQLVLPLQK